MNSNTQVFFDFPTTFRTLLRSPPGINFTEELSSLPAHVLNDGSKLPERCIKHMFPKHPFCTGAVIQVFHENHITSVTKGMSLLKMKVLPGVIDLVVKSCNFKTLFLIVFRLSLFSREPALQQLQLALQLLKKLRRFYENTVTSCQKLLQPNVNSNRMTMWHWVRNTNITLNADRCIPLVGFPQDSYLFDHKSVRDRSMQVNGNCSNFGQFNMQVRYWIFLELREKQRKKLPIFLESGKAKTSLLKVFPTLVQLLNSLLENLRRNFTKLRKFFLSFGQVIKLIDFTREFQFRGNDVLFFKRASINQALTTIAPILYLPQCVVEGITADFHPLNEHLLLNGVWINLIAVCKCNHSSSILNLLGNRQALNVKRWVVVSVSEAERSSACALARTPSFNRLSSPVKLSL